MKHKTVGTRAGHKIFIRERSTAFDKFNKKTSDIESSFGEMNDHKKMNTYEYAAFQKKVFKEKRKQKKKTRILIIVSIFVAIGILSLLPKIIEIIFDDSYQDLVF